MRPLFADPKTDFVFKRIFGTEEHKGVLIAFLNHLLELDEPHRIVEVELLSPEQRPAVDGLKNSIVDVKCIDARGTRYVVEMQVLNVEGFEKRAVHDAAKTYLGQLSAGQLYPTQNDIIGVTIADFEIWPERDPPHVPMLSRWRMQAPEHGGERDLGQVQLVFLELPKHDASRPPRTPVEKWAYFFREAGDLKVVPEVLAEQPFAEALDAARLSSLRHEEWDAYIDSGMAIQNKRGALALARRQGHEQGFKEGIALSRGTGLRAVVRRLLEHRGLTLSPEDEARIDACSDLTTLERWLEEAAVASTAAEALR
ncbi:MAG TPA: Rpn family recombination-promoting nuclease/putative transposase [Candidatus Nanopelagicales bacterium]|nr:Rpn family recombination-promoting nuclease/putative transposase [Candidatus Nanopelagicales bacterium]